MKESQIEKAIVKYAKNKGILSFKFNSRNIIGVPDRIFISAYNNIFFIEFKRPKGSLTTIQNYIIKILREKGCNVHLVGNIEQGKQIIDNLGVIYNV